MLRNVAILALGASATLASPVWRRQETSSSSISGSPASSALASTTSVPATATDTASIASSASSAISSAVSSASVNTTVAPAPTGTPANNGTNTNDTTVYAYGCPTGYSLTYVLGTSTYPAINITTAYNALFNWNVALPPPIVGVSQNGSGPGQAQRSWTIPGQNFTVSELLTNQTANASTGYLDEVWVSTQAINVSSSLVIANATSDLTLFANATSNNVTTVQFYVNFCASSQTVGLALYSELVSTYLTGLNALFLNSTTSGTNSTASSTSSMASSASSTVASATSAISSSASSAVSGATSSVDGGLSTAASAVSGAASTAVSGATSVADTAIAGASSVASVGLSGASSVAGAITSIF